MKFILLKNRFVVCGICLVLTFALGGTLWINHYLVNEYTCMSDHIYKIIWNEGKPRHLSDNEKQYIFLLKHYIYAIIYGTAYIFLYRHIIILLC